jgi:uncharacterized protein
MLERLKLRSVFLAVTFLLSITIIAHAMEIPAPTGYRVNDFAGVLKAETKEQLESKLRTFEKETTTQIVVAIFSSLEDESLEDFVNRMFIAWKIGQQQNNNGVLLGIFINERKVRIEVGYGLEGALTDALSSRIIRNELAPDFKTGNYDAGVVKTVDAITKAVRGEYTAPPESDKPQTSYFGLLVFFMIIMFIIFRVMRSPVTIGPYSRRRRYDDTWGSGGGWYSGGSGWGGGGWGGGSSGGGFSGGGGSSGGGGASGSW